MIAHNNNVHAFTKYRKMKKFKWHNAGQGLFAKCVLNEIV